MKFNVIAFALLFIVLSIASLYSILMYQQILAQDAQEGQLLSQVKVVKLEYNSSDPTVTMGTHSGGSFLFNITYENPTNSACTISIFGIDYYRENSAASRKIALNYSFPSTFLLPNCSSLTIPVELDYVNNTQTPEINGTNPVFIFYIRTTAWQSISARELGSTVQGSNIDNYVIGRTSWDQTYGLLSYYSTVAAIAWIIGPSLVFAVMLFMSKSKPQIERWAACVFTVNTYSVCTAFVLAYLPQPGPSIYTPYTPTGAAGGFGEFFVNSVFWLGLILGCALNLYAIASLLRHSQQGKIRYYLAAGSMIVGFTLSFLAPMFYHENGIAFLVFVIIAVVNLVTLLRLRQIHLNK